jgi:hypothetical protein
VWTGRLPYGKCDIVPGEFFVATEFQHIAWLPIIPIQSWLIVDGSIETCDDFVSSFNLKWEGMPIQFSVKSFLLAWVRTCLLFLQIAAGLYLSFILILWIAGNRPLVEAAMSLGIIIASLLLYWLSLKVAYASHQRAEYLRGLIARNMGRLEPSLSNEEISHANANPFLWFDMPLHSYSLRLIFTILTAGVKFCPSAAEL